MIFASRPRLEPDLKLTKLPTPKTQVADKMIKQYSQKHYQNFQRSKNNFGQSNRKIEVPIHQLTDKFLDKFKF